MSEAGWRTYQNYGELPQAVQDFIYDIDNDDTSRLIDECGLSGENLKFFFEETKKVYLRQAAAQNLFVAVKDRVKGVDENKLKTLVRDFCGFRFLPLDDFLRGEAAAAIVSLGGSVSDYPAKRIVIRSVLPAEAVAEFLREREVKVPAYLEQRLREILESRVRGVRKDEETVSRLIRAEKIGGVELPRAEAQALVAALAAKMLNVNITPDAPMPSLVPAAKNDNPATTPSAIAVVPAAPVAALAVVSSKKGHTVSPEDDREVGVIRDTIVSKLVAAQTGDREKEISEAIDAVVSQSGVAVPKDSLNRYRTIIESRLKGVRDTVEMRSLLSRSPQTGGMGLGTGIVEKIISETEAQVTALSQKHDEQIKKEKDEFIRSSVKNSFAKEEMRKFSEEEDADRLYGALTGKRPVPAAVKAAVPPPSSPPAAPPKAPSPAPSPYLYRPPPVVSPKLQDVRPPVSFSAPFSGTAKLVGPVEELKNMTLLDFRRLSADPVEACRRVNDKIDLLEEQSYGLRIEGIKAWQASAVNRAYLDIITASFSGGKSVALAIDAALAAGKDTPTEREVRAIMDLNRRLKA
jgi:hypothetical protein